MKTSHIITFYALQILRKGFSSLSARKRFYIASRIGEIFYNYLGLRKDQARANIQRAFPNLNTDKIEKSLKNFGILKYKNFLVSECSSGIKKKAELSKLNFDESFKLKCWLLDEPLNHLDENGKLFLKKIMDKFINMNGTILQTSHEKKINHKNFKIIKL